MADSTFDDAPLSHYQGRYLARKLGLTLPHCSSNHLTPTKNERFYAENDVLIMPVADSRPIIKRKVLRNSAGYPYRPARLAPADHDVTKPWYIIFYLWDIGKQKLVRKRVLKNEFDEIHSRNERLSFAEKMIGEINYCLRSGMYAEGSPERKLPGFDFRGYSIVNAINYAINYKIEVEGVKESTTTEYVKLRTCIEHFLKLNGLPAGYKLSQVNSNFINRFFPYLKEVRKIANNSYNTRRTTFHSVIQALMKKDPKLFPNGNPIADVKKLKVEVRKHAPYSTDQMQKLQAAILQKGDKQLLLFIQFMFYTLARPKEIESLKVGNIFMNERRILFRGESAKTSIEEYAGVPERLASIIEQSDVLKHDPDHYVFGSHGRPALQRVGKNYFYKRLVPIIDKLGFYNVNKNYTLYSFKHTGAISLYQATRDIKLLQAQCRHRNIEQTNNYLRDLGMFQDLEKLKQWEGPL